MTSNSLFHTFLVTKLSKIKLRLIKYKHRNIGIQMPTQLIDIKAKKLKVKT